MFSVLTLADPVEHGCNHSNHTSLGALPQPNGPLDLSGLQAKVDVWLGGQPMVGSLFSHPLADFDVYKDAERLVNRIYYAVFQFSYTSRRFRLFVFFEEVTFLEDETGDLVPVNSEYFVPEEF